MSSPAAPAFRPWPPRGARPRSSRRCSRHDDRPGADRLRDLRRRPGDGRGRACGAVRAGGRSGAEPAARARRRPRRPGGGGGRRRAPPAPPPPPRRGGGGGGGGGVGAGGGAPPPLLVSHDAGTTWQESGRGLPAGRAVAIADDDPDLVVYAARNRLYVSRNGGLFWTALAVELPEISAVAVREG